MHLHNINTYFTLEAKTILNVFNSENREKKPSSIWVGGGGVKIHFVACSLHPSIHNSFADNFVNKMFLPSVLRQHSLNQSVVNVISNKTKLLYSLLSFCLLSKNLD